MTSIAFGPEALSRFNQIIEEVSLNLVDDGLAAELVKSDEMRRKLANRLLGFARLCGQTLKSARFC